MPKQELLTQKELKNLFTYNPETGIFTSNHKTHDIWPAGRKVGTYNNGYKITSINGTMFKLHRLAWLYVYGKWPKGQIDHINGIRDDNRIANLRDATQLQNGKNQKLRPSNTSGFKGVTFFKRDGNWRAQIMVNYKQMHIGYFDTPEEAHAAYCDAAKRLHGEFWRAE